MRMKKLSIFTLLSFLLIMMLSTASEGKIIAKTKNKYYKIVIKREIHYDTECFIAVIRLKKAGYKKFGTASAKNRKLAYETTLEASRRLKATLCVNCDYANGNRYTNARSKKVWVNTRGYAGKDWVPAIYDRWRGILSSPLLNSYYTGNSLKWLVKKKRVSDTFNFGWAILLNRKIPGKKNAPASRAQRTFIGTNEKPGYIVIVVTRGRYQDGYSKGLTPWECGALLKKNCHCSFGVMLDGGGSSCMVYKGVDISTPPGHSERKVTDFIYLK